MEVTSISPVAMVAMNGVTDIAIVADSRSKTAPGARTTAAAGGAVK
ncbi:hypothetical protein [Methylocystis iwaonis]|nr:hypothetical protein [Methylocystis iwaonis]